MTDDNESLPKCPDCGKREILIEISMAYTAIPVVGSQGETYVVEKSEIDNLLSQWMFDAVCDECGWTEVDADVKLDVELESA